MQVEVLARPGAAAARLRLAAGEKITCEVGAMIAMSPGLQVATTARTRQSGFLRGIKRMLAGENFFMNEFTAQGDGQELIIGPPLVGDVMHHRLEGGSIIVQGSSWLASSGNVELDMAWQGFGNALFSGERAFWVKCSGTGHVLVNSYGGIYEVNMRDSYTVDTGHVVAFEDTLRFRVGRAADSWLDSLLTGEGLACKFSGEGKLWCQTHNPTRLGQALGPQLKPRLE